MITTQLSNGKRRFFPTEKVKLLEVKLKNAQRILDRKKSPSKNNPNHKAKNYNSQIVKINKIHTKIKNIRLDFNHKMTTQIAKSHSLVVLEDLSLKNMSKSARGTLVEPGTNVAAKSGLNKSLLRPGLGIQAEFLDYKCRWYKSKLVLVPAKNSSRECSCCGYASKKNRISQSIFNCQNCGHTENADLNAAKVILARGQRVLARGEDVSEVVNKPANSKNSSKDLKRKEARTTKKSIQRDLVA